MSRSGSYIRLGLRLAAFLYYDVVDDPEESGFQEPAAFRWNPETQGFLNNIEAVARGSVTPRMVDELDVASNERCVLLTFDDRAKSALRISAFLESRTDSSCVA